ncbi:BREX-1 system adenine-specific DNA-methyltransferase PglX [Peribacillus simplex]|uniref:BREX-1 system adenine-specific DNA-methyltransferase PglX n=1 Tax=Peribacillus simplex TaxID=1478 RepID=UPI002E1CB8AD|nr:BREX-1 system adenine-specific DNA-methyltransferase PglX [Peribacillus simplex]MED3986959.1 BREX-1 system adenine-specific DNA-methyltransferase PglX [Peribacillus simplex]MED4094231.1 BREX-1 system adenine-specific DNA-methyltransferase PglX [Peribacillus simplex]
MNKSALKTFATSARKELLKKVEAKAMKIGITEDNIKKADIESSDAIFIDGRQLSKEEKVQRDKLIARINQIGFKQVMEEVAYTWFNRFTALRYMEVNEYLPTDVRILSSSNAESADPDMMNEALSLELEIDKEYVYDLKLNNKSEELFKYLIIKHCNDLNRYLPFMFETLDDYTEILFPEGLLAKDSFIRQMTDTEFIPENNWKKVEVIGWLYQFYIAEEKDRVFKEKKKYKPEEIPFATQLFTPDWIVRYMVQNSLGRYWVESHTEHRDLLENWEFYLENPNPERDFEEKIAPYINKELKVEDIKCFDPAMGSGHILVYMFDVLYEIYSKCGYMEREIPRLIIENNLYGLDIDDRAYQLACFSVVMKALEYNGRFLRSIEREGLSLNLASIQETNSINNEVIAYIAEDDSGGDFEKTKEFINQFRDAKTIGSLIRVYVHDKGLFEQKLKVIKENPAQDLFEVEIRKKVLDLLPKLLKQAEIMYLDYDILVTNPPYMGGGNMNAELSNFLKKHYPDSKSDLFASFMEIDHYIKEKGFYASINQHSWMFLSSFEKLRKKVIENKSISTMLHLGPRAFEEIGGEVVQSTAFVLRNVSVPNINGSYVRLINERTAREKREKTIEARNNPNVSYLYSFDQNNYSKIPGSPIAYWVSNQHIKIFGENQEIGKKAHFKSGMSTTNNNRFLRYWHEVSHEKIAFQSKNYNEVISNNRKWVPYNKGGGTKKWYGYNQYLVNWYNNGEEIKLAVVSNPSDPKTTHWSRRIFNHEYFFKEGLTWSTLSSGSFSMRYFPNGFIFDSKGACVFFENEDQKLYSLGLLNSKVANTFLEMLSPTLDFNPGQVSKVPYIYDNDKVSMIDKIVHENILLSKNDWDSYETSWDFSQHPLIKQKKTITTTIREKYEEWKTSVDKEFYQLKTNEEKLNSIFIDIYGLQNELSPEVKGEDVAFREMDANADIKSFISYAVGCSFGRYSLDEEGLVYAGGEFDSNRYKVLKVDKDNILPILAGAYFEDDIVSKFIEFVQITFGEETLTENLNFIADTLGKKKGETAKESIRRYFLNDFHKDHVQTYKKRPIYWLFTSGKQKAFNCLVYMHRYDKTTLSRIRTDYLHEYQIRLDAEKKDLLSIIEGDFSTTEISNAKKELKTLDKKIEELKEYDELLHHMADMQIEIDLDEGVVVNYEKFKGLVAKI